MKVCIDAGHGGKDSGAVGATVSEKWITLDVANRIAQKLQNSGIDVVMTRDSDYFVELADRTKIANNAGADVFVSIHCNSAGPEVRGTEVWYYPGASEDSRLAKSIRDKLIARTGFHDRGVKEESFAVLRLTKCPASLVELGFISSKQEEKVMMSFDFQDGASTAIVDGIKEFAGIKETNALAELESVNDIVWELSNRGIIANKELWLKKLAKDNDIYWLVRKCANALRRE